MKSARKRVNPARVRDLVLAGGILGVVAVAATTTMAASAVGANLKRSEAAATLDGISPAYSDRAVLPVDFPADLHGDGGLQVESARFLAESQGTMYWAALDNENNICLVALDIALPVRNMSSCTGGDEFKAAGIGMAALGSPWTFETYLIPEGVDASEAQPPYFEISPNLVGVDGDANADELRLPSDEAVNGSAFWSTPRLRTDG